MAYPDTLDTGATLPNSRIPGDRGSAPDNNKQANAIIAIETKVGINGSLDPNSLEFRVASLEAGGGGGGGGPITDIVFFDENGDGWNINIFSGGSTPGSLTTVATGTTGFPNTYTITY